jgi:hypothetical protein
VLQHIVVAGVDYWKQHGPDFCDFAAMADRRARTLLADPSVPAEVRLIDAGAGTTTIYSTTSGKLLVERPRQDYGAVWDQPRYEDEPWDHEPPPSWRGPIFPSQRVLRRDQLDLFNVMYLYDAIWNMGITAPGSLGEVAFLTHGTLDGPALLGSRYTPGHELMGTNNLMWFPTAGLTQVTQSHAPPHGPLDPDKPVDPFDTWRDPCDTDARVLQDLDLYTLARDEARLRSAFSKEGRVRVFGGTFSLADTEFLFASAWSRDLQRDGPVFQLVTVETLSPEALVLVGLHFHRDPAVEVGATSARLPRGHWYGFLRSRFSRCWAAQMARLLGVAIYAPPPGIVASPSADGYMALEAQDVVEKAISRFVPRFWPSAPDPEDRGCLRFEP